jgi:hypothetical protein
MTGTAVPAAVGPSADFVIVARGFIRRAMPHPNLSITDPTTFSAPDNPTHAIIAAVRYLRALFAYLPEIIDG